MSEDYVRPDTEPHWMSHFNSEGERHHGTLEPEDCRLCREERQRP